MRVEQAEAKLDPNTQLNLALSHIVMQFQSEMTQKSTNELNFVEFLKGELQQERILRLQAEQKQTRGEELLENLQK